MATSVSSAFSSVSSVRNICIVAHIDHGKSTLADHLVALNNHISSRLLQAASSSEKPLRFLDSRNDEIERQITIKSSCISLLVPDPSGSASSAVINLVDSPGHLDYNAEVSSGARLCDGALLVVDAVEGVRAQTRTVMRQIFADRLQPLLFINKIDRLLGSVCSDPRDAYSRLRSIIEDVNSLFAQMISAVVIENHDQLAKVYFFDPTLGNVLFGSALHGFVFDLSSWASKLVLPKLQAPAESTGSAPSLDFVASHLWGEFTVQTGTQFSVIPSASSAKPNTAVKFMLEPLMKLLKTSDTSPKSGPFEKLRNLFPLGQELVRFIFNKLPDPIQANVFRASALQLPVQGGTQRMLGYVSKQLPADLERLVLVGDRAEEVPEFVALMRVFYGSLEVGDEVECLPEGSTKTKVAGIFALLGSSLLPLQSAKTGAVVALKLEPESSHSAGGVTLVSDRSEFPADFRGLPSPYHAAQPIVRVSVTARKLADEARLDRGLSLLARSDPAVVLERLPETGERVVACAGQEHLQKCVHDLLHVFAHGISVDVSRPIVEIRESLCSSSFPASADDGDDAPASVFPEFLAEFKSGVTKFGVASACSPDGAVTVKVRARPMSIDLLDFFDSQNEVEVTGDSAEKRGGVSARLWQAATSRLGGLVALHLKKAACTALCIGGGGGQECPIAVTQTLIQGFEAASRCGPLAGEPLRGVVWELLEVIGDEAALNTWSATSAMMAACRAAFVNANPRISEPLLMVELLTEGHMAKVQAVLAQRRAEILQSDFIEGNYQEHVIKAEIPAFELFADSAAGFADSLRSAARGKILWTVVFSRWSVISDDPFIEGSVARRILFDLRRRKGLSTGEKIVAVAEKQRTLTRNK